MIVRFALGLVVVAVVALGIVYAAGRGYFAPHEGGGEVTETPRPAAAVDEVRDAFTSAARGIGVPAAKQILFGDLHVHTTFSFDAYMLSLPVLGGEGAHPPADACDFARYCSALDFWSINDHAFSITPEHWRETVESIRQCNAVSGGGDTPDTVAFLGWEWTQVGLTPDKHFGHKNVILAHTDEERIPARPIAALRGGFQAPNPLGMGVFALRAGGRMHGMARYFAEWGDVPDCPTEGHVRELPTDCIEQAATPADLFRKLDEWGLKAIVIPHGTTWGFYTPPGSSWDKQLEGAMHDPDRQTLLEVYSGHGDSEVYRPWRAVSFDADGTARCPEPSADYLPSCWRAGEIIRERCLGAGIDAAACEQRAVAARAQAAAAGVAVHRTVPGSRGPDFLDAGQCRDCAEPAFNYRPGGAAQYILALSNFSDGSEPRRFRMGFMASSDIHFGRPGTGYKEVRRLGFTESRTLGGGAGPLGRLFQSPPEEPVAESRAFVPERLGFDIFETERQASFFLTGGLVAAHADGRTRDDVWNALQRREVYGTSGPRILLWFDLLNPPGSRGDSLPMGSDVAMTRDPIFQVRAVGSFEQSPGCPEYAAHALGPERLQRLCLGECYHPSDRRRKITRIDVVRIRPQATRDEDVAHLIGDPWLTLPCDPDPAGCAATFSDPDFARSGRDTVYYVRAHEEPAPAINAASLNCERDDAGNCLRPRPCTGSGDCLSEHEPRAWSSPIFVDYARAR